jgi:RecA/RadA recombinase
VTARIEVARVSSAVPRLASGEHPPVGNLSQDIARTLANASTGRKSRGPARAIRLLTYAEILNLPPLEYLMEGLFPRGGLYEMHGPPGSGKSFAALSLALSVATGIPFLGHSVCHRGGAVFIAGEGISGVGARVEAWSNANPGVDSIDIQFVAHPIQLLAEVDVDDFLRAINTRSVPPAIIVIDTLARCSAGADENSARDMGQLIDGMDRLRIETGAAVLAVHHSRKDGDVERGSTALRGAMDTMIGVRMRSGLVTLTCEKQKDGPTFAPLRARLVARGRSCFLESEMPAELTRTTLSDNQRKALESLQLLTLTEPVTTGDWASASGLPSSTFFEAVKLLVKSEMVSQIKNGREVLNALTVLGNETITPYSEKAPESSSGSDSRSIHADCKPIGSSRDGEVQSDGAHVDAHAGSGSR